MEVNKNLMSHRNWRYQNVICRCEHCNFKALNAKHLDQHVRLAHTDVKRVVINCEFCDFSTINKNQYIKHLTKDHKGAKGFMCETCGKKFATGELH